MENCYIFKKLTKHISHFLFAVISLATFPHTSFAQTCEQWVAKVISAQGDIVKRTSNNDSWSVISSNQTFCAGETIQVKDNSRLALLLNNNTILRLDQNSTVTLSGFKNNKSTWIELVEGVSHFISRIKNSFKVVTPYVNASVEGTEFIVAVKQQRAEVNVIEGKVLTSNNFGQVALTNGESSISKSNQAPLLKKEIKPEDAVVWALYYPAVTDFTQKSFQATSDGFQKQITESLGYYSSGNATSALNALNNITTIPNDEMFLLYRATLFLTVGRAESASQDLSNILEINPKNSNAMAIKSIIELTQNHIDSALTFAQKAIELDSINTSNLTALSYVYQAQFKINDALLTMQKAVKQTPEDAIAWARLAELYLSTGDIDEALKAAKTASSIKPNLARTQSVLGFSYLISLDIENAESSFSNAIKYDQAAPLPRLGLGLALIRQGKLEQGRRQIEYATSLSPNNALIRSYLGKAYFEEKRNSLAETQFDLAKEFDSKDPTAWFYDAIQKQTENKPVQALQSLQKSIDLNDNRAVYRSRLLLDEDLAARSASLARTYRDLGFNRMALTESWKSLAFNPGNYSAHRFLAESYANTPRHEIARVSELLQSQMLNPTISTPVSPSAGETNLHSFQGTGPSTAGFNEYNSLFNRKKYSLLLSGITGKNDTKGGEITAGAFFNRGMISAGRFTDRSDGVRENNDHDQTVDNVFGQFRVSSKLSLQAEYRKRENEFGDLTLRINEKVSTVRQNLRNDGKRFGLNYQFSATHAYILMMDTQNLTKKSVRGSSGLLNTRNFDSEKTVFEGQHIYRKKKIKSVSGGSFLNKEVNITDIDDLSAFLPPPDHLIINKNKSSFEQMFVYSYSYFTLPSGQIILGGDFANINEQSGLDFWRFNPKLGLVLDIEHQTIFRLAAFRTVRTELANDQTLSPTQIAGFNQFFDNFLGSEAERVGLGLDKAFIHDIYAGLEVSWRKITDQFYLNGEISEEAQKENSNIVYLNWTPNPSLTLNVSYELDKFEREYDPNRVEDRPVAIKTKTLPLEVQYFIGTSWYGRLKSTYVDQSVTDVSSNAGPTVIKGEFWVSDLAFGYRIPKRYGIIEASVRNIFGESFKFQSVEPGSDSTIISSPYYPTTGVFIAAQFWL